MIHLYKMINGKLTFVDIGVLQHRFTYELQGYYVRVVDPRKRKATERRLNITVTHRIRRPVKISIFTRAKRFIESLMILPQPCYA